MKFFNKRLIGNIDWKIIILLLLIFSQAMVILYSAGFNTEKNYSDAMNKQLISYGIGFFLFSIVMFINPIFWQRYAMFIYIVGCISLVFILFGGVVAGGARRWLDLGGFRVQPSEFVKLAMILLLARYLSSDKIPKDGFSFFGLFWPALIISIPMVLTIVQPDLGTGLVFLLVGGSMLLVAGIRFGALIKIIIAGMITTVLAWNFVLMDYQKKRVFNFLSPELDPRGSGYHALQSKIAVGSGALTGKGFLQGTQTQLRFLPEQTTDFIFSVLAEEWGFWGSVLVIFLYALLILKVFQVSIRSTDTFQSFVALGVGALLFWHVFINVGMVIGVMPVVGITMTLLSFGGSSVVTMLTALGIVSGFSIRRYMFT